jgi:hypothetical protein
MMTTMTTMTKAEQRALCEWALTQCPITRTPAGARNYSARAMRSLERDPRSRASLDARRGALRRMGERRSHGEPRGRDARARASSRILL